MPARVLDQAIAWQLRIDSGDATEQDRRELESWLQAHPDHLRAWSQLGAMDAELQLVRSDTVRAVVVRGRPRWARRVAAVAGALAVVALSIAALDRYQPVAGLLADYHTATGERRRVPLPDATTLDLNTRSAVDLAFDGEQRAIRLLAGEIHVETAHAAGETRPFVVLTPDGALRALGTRFLVRRDAGGTVLTVLESAVAVADPQAAQACRSVWRERGATCEAERVVAPGQTMQLTPDGGRKLRPAMPEADAWKDGMLVVDNRTLADVAAEIARYRPGRVSVDPGVAQLRVTGSFPLADTDLALAALAGGLPVQIRRVTGLWVEILPAAGPARPR